MVIKETGHEFFETLHKILLSQKVYRNILTLIGSTIYILHETYHKVPADLAESTVKF